MKKNLKTILAGLTATAIFSTAPVALNAYSINEPELFVQTEKGDLHINFSEDGSKFAYTKIESRGFPTLSKIILNEGGVEKELTKGNYFDIKPAFSPDGNKIAFFRTIAMGHGYVCVMDSDGKNLEEIIPSTITKVSWSPDGKEIAYTEYTKKKGERKTYKTIRLVDVETEESKYLANDENWYENPEFTADGRIVYTFREKEDDNKSIWVMDKDGSNKNLLVSGVTATKKIQNDDGSITIHKKEKSAESVSIDGDLMAYLQSTTHFIYKATPVLNSSKEVINYEVESIKEEYRDKVHTLNL